MDAREEPIREAPPRAALPGRGSPLGRAVGVVLALAAVVALPLGGRTALGLLDRFGPGAAASDARIWGLAIGLWLAPFALLATAGAGIAVALRCDRRRLAVALAIPALLVLYFAVVLLLV